MKANLKTQLLLLGSGIIGMLMVFQFARQSKNQRLRFVESGLEDKNFGAFPPDIPENQFTDALFV